MTKNIAGVAGIAMISASILLCGCTQELGRASVKMVPPTVPLDCGDRILMGWSCPINPALYQPAPPLRGPSISPIERARGF
jgi:hypothetical protein